MVVTWPCRGPGERLRQLRVAGLGVAVHAYRRLRRLALLLAGCDQNDQNMQVYACNHEHDEQLINLIP
jgi:hypothetical protein